MAVDPRLVGELLMESLLARLGEEVEIVFTYGSMVKGSPHRFSDFDISYVPVHESTCDSITVVVDDIMCDLYPLQWSRLENMAEFRDASGSILQHGRVVYQRSEDAGRRFQALGARHRALMEPEQRGRMLWLSLEIFQRIGYEYYLLRDQADRGHLPSCRRHAQNILATVMHCLMVCNQRSIDTRKMTEVLTLPRLPVGFAELADKVAAANGPAVLLNACEDLLKTTRAMLLAEQRQVHRQDTTFAGVFGVLYPELKNMLQRIVICCERQDIYGINSGLATFCHELALPMSRATTGVTYSGFNALAEYADALTCLGLPDLWSLAAKRDFTGLSRECAAIDKQLQEFLSKQGVPLFAFSSLEELREHLARSARQRSNS